MRCLTALHAEHPGDLEAQASLGEALFGLGDLAGARVRLEARLASAEPYARRAQHLVLLGRCLEADRETDLALARFEAALALEPANARGARARSRSCTSAPAASSPRSRPSNVGRSSASIRRSAPAVCCAQPKSSCAWAGVSASAEQHLRAALDGRSGPGPRVPAARDAAVGDESRRRGAGGRHPRARERSRAPRNARASRCSARACSNAAASRSWRPRRSASPRRPTRAASRRPSPPRGCCGHRANGVPRAPRSRSFAARHPGDDPAGLADVFDQLGRLRAGPLEDVDGAIQAYRRALELEPERTATRTALAQLLSQRPGDWPEALRHHRAALEADPTLASLVARRLAHRRRQRAPGSRCARSRDPARARRRERRRSRGRACRARAIARRRRQARRPAGRDRPPARAAGGGRDRRGARLLAGRSPVRPARATSPPSARLRSPRRVASRRPPCCR